MSEDELVAAFRAGRLSRRAFVRQLVDRGMPLGDALEFAERLVPEAPSGGEPARDPQRQPRDPQRPETGARRLARELSLCPVQVDGLEVAPVADGYTILHSARDRVHSLNGTAVLVFELCNGRNDAERIAALVQRAFGLPDPPLAETQRCLEMMFAEGLIQ